MKKKFFYIIYLFIIFSFSTIIAINQQHVERRVSRQTFSQVNTDRINSRRISLTRFSPILKCEMIGFSTVLTVGGVFFIARAIGVDYYTTDFCSLILGALCISYGCDLCRNVRSDGLYSYMEDGNHWFDDEDQEQVYIV